MRGIRRIVLAATIAPIASGVAQQKEGFPPDNPDSWRLAGTAKVFCSGLFVSGRDSAELRSHLSAYFLGPKLDSLTNIHIDRQRKLVRLTLANRLTREAKQYGDQGCVIHQPGKDTVYFRPVRVASALPPASTQPWPMGDVLPATPLPAEIDTAKLRMAVDAAFANPAGLTAGFVVVYKDRIIAERYGNGANKDMQLESWSMGKSITGTLIGRLIQQGALTLENAAPVPNWRKTPDDPRAKIRVMDLMRMSSGLRFSRGSPEDLVGYHDHDLIYTGALDAFEFVTTRPLQFPPNTMGRYRNTDPLTLGLIIRDAVRKRGEEYLTYPQRELFDKIGIRRQVLETDPYGNFLLSGYDYGTARNWARLGMLYVNDGVWMGQRLLPEGFVRFVGTPAPAWADSSYGGMVWVNGRGTWPVPRDAFAFRGAGGQETYVIPSRRMVVVRMGHFPGQRAGAQDLQRSLALLMEAVGQGPHASQDSSGNARLRALYTAEWNWRQREMGRRNAAPGDAGAGDRFPRVDAASQQARLTYWERTLRTLDSIPLTTLSPEEQVNAEVFRTTIRALATDVRYRTYEAPLNSDTFFWTEFTPRQGFASADVYRNYIGRLSDVPRYFDENVANMRAGMARGYTVPRVSATGRERTIEPYVRGDSTNPLYTPFLAMPATIPAVEQAAMRREALTLLRDVVAPSYQKLLTFMRSEYLPATRTNLAASSLPDGPAFYQAMIEKFTTLDLTAQQIHDIGLREVARIRAEMEATKQRAGFTGTMAEFFTFLRTDPQFYARTPRELLSYSAYVSKKADWKLSETIGLVPRRRHGIRPVPEALAPIYTGGRGGLESCLMNTYNLPARPLYTLASLTLHECTPGHSFQAALALEGPERPPFRRAAGFSGYTEGWGLYTEWLGTVMGIYETPYEDFGRLTYEMWRACRLVIDTGIHQFGWSRERAMDYLRTNAALSEHEITTEVERYIAWPGQALAYKLGEIQIRRHRREAEEKLGAAFDQRYFHDAILALGSVPLPVLERRMAQFIADGGRNP